MFKENKFNKTENGGNRDYDCMIYDKGIKHQNLLNVLAEKLKYKFDESQLFNPVVQEEIDQFAKKPETIAELEKLYQIFESKPSFNSPGHDKAHIIDNLVSVMRIFKEYEISQEPLTQGEKLEIVLAIGGHDLGRFLEERLDKISKKDLSYLAPAMVYRDPKVKKTMELPKNLSLRILYDIFSSSSPETKHRTADIVHQCDREQLIASATIARGLAFDVVLSGRDLAIPLKEKLAKRLPIPESADDKDWLIQYEFFMRNIYEPASSGSKAMWDQIKTENSVILMLGLEGKDEEYKQVFGPELGLIKQGDEGVHWSKKPIPNEVYERAKTEKDDYMKKLDFSEYKPGEELELAMKIMQTDHIAMPNNFQSVLEEKLAKCNEQERKNFWAILKYSLSKRHEKRVQDLKLLDKTEGIDAIVGNWIKKELESREEKFSKI